MTGATQKTTRVAIVVPTHWDFLMGGAQLQAKFLLEELVTRPGVEAHFFASRVDPNTNTDGKYQLTQVAQPSALHRYGLFWDYLALQRHLAAYRPHLIYQRVASAYTGICARFAKKNDIPLIWHVANSTDCKTNHFGYSSLRRPHTYLEHSLVQYGLTSADKIIVQNNDQREQLRQNFDKQNVHLIPNFHPFPKAPVKPSAPPLRLIWIANLKDTKQPQAMVDIGKRLAHLPEIKITMVGAPYLGLEQAKQDAFERSIADLPNVTYAGALPIEEVNELLAHSHLLINTSIKEGFSNTFIQAWMRCVPVLTIGINPDNLLDGGPLGESFNSIDALAAAVVSRLENHTQITDNGMAARQTAERDFSLENAKQLADLVLSLRN